MKKLTHAEVQSRIDEAHGKNKYILLEEYKNRRTKILTKHTECGYTYRIYNILYNKLIPS